MRTINGKQLFEVVAYEESETEGSRVITHPFSSRKSLDAFLDTMRKNDPTFAARHYVAKFYVKYSTYEIIEPEVGNAEGR